MALPILGGFLGLWYVLCLFQHEKNELENI